ncbi:Nif3-like dinuclear metal center hexameric protein [bacterium]|nr:MAG: Nif3-like dinuclear metal center hexameric protein [bacterium]
MKLKWIVSFLDDYLSVDAFRLDSSLNGLQVEASSTVKRAAVAVDASERSIRAAARKKAELLIVHHGIFWSCPTPITGVIAARIKLLFSKGVSLYAAHLPLDCNEEVGNNAVFARLLSLSDPKPFGDYKGVKIGVAGNLRKPVTINALAARVRRSIGGLIQLFPFGPAKINRVGIVSGDGASFAEEASETGCDVLITGESSHSAYHTAAESGISLICAGHYATETLGVRELAGVLTDRLGIETLFIDIPTGL